MSRLNDRYIPIKFAALVMRCKRSAFYMCCESNPLEVKMKFHKRKTFHRQPFVIC